MQTVARLQMCFKLLDLPVSYSKYLCDMFQPTAQSNKHKEHGWSVKKGDGTLAGSLSYGYNEDHTGVYVGNRGS